MIELNFKVAKNSNLVNKVYIELIYVQDSEPKSEQFIVKGVGFDGKHSEPVISLVEKYVWFRDILNSAGMINYDQACDISMEFSDMWVDTPIEIAGGPVEFRLDKIRLLAYDADGVKHIATV